MEYNLNSEDYFPNSSNIIPVVAAGALESCFGFATCCYVVVLTRKGRERKC
jgi:hypothetical protein